MAVMVKVTKADEVISKRGSVYPGALAEPLQGRLVQPLADAVGLSQFGVNLVTLEPGAWSTQRHWHENEDELVYILTGEPTLITDEGEQILRSGMAAGFKAGDANGHHLVNRTAEPVTFIVVGTRAAEERGHYPDVDLRAFKANGAWTFTNKKGEPRP
jgi:uncharacterized cupin superfamily protein